MCHVSTAVWYDIVTTWVWYCIRTTLWDHRGTAQMCEVNTSYDCDLTWLIFATWLRHFFDMPYGVTYSWHVVGHYRVRVIECMSRLNCAKRVVNMTHMRDVAVWFVWCDSYVRHDEIICVTRLVQMCDSFIRVIWLIHTCDVNRSYVWHDSFIRVTCLVHMCDMTHLYVWHDSSICVTWLVHMCDMTRSYVWHDSSICVTW